MKPLIPYSVALRQQPDALALALDNIRESVRAARLQPWAAGESVAVIAMGASRNSAHALIAALTAVGVRGANITASDLYDAPPGFQPGDHCVIVSESGRSPEPLRVAHQLGAGRRIGITNDPHAPISQVVDSLITLGDFEDSPVYCVGYTASLLAYSELLRATGHAQLAIDGEAVPGMVAAAISEYEKLAPALAHHFAAVTSIDCVGRGYSYATATEAALVIREAARVSAAAYDTYEYLHGPMEPAKSGTGLIIFGDDRELDLIPSQLEAGVAVLLVTADSSDISGLVGRENLRVVTVPAEATRFARAIVEIVLVQLLAEQMAAARALIIEEFLYEQDDTKLKEAAED